MVIVGCDLGSRAMQGFQKGNRKTTDWKAESTATSGCRKDGQTIGFVMKKLQNGAPYVLLSNILILTTRSQHKLHGVYTLSG
jgi:hypothetical protein